ncbi:MAG: hypothetical protein ACXW30_01690 [Micavibrio sp.]
MSRSFFKKTVCALAAFAMAAGMSGCGNTNEPAPSAENAAPVASAQAFPRNGATYSINTNGNSGFVGHDSALRVTEFTPRTAPDTTCVAASNSHRYDSGVGVQCFPKDDAGTQAGGSAISTAFQRAGATYSINTNGNSGFVGQDSALRVTEFTPRTAPNMTCVATANSHRYDSGVGLQCVPKVATLAP